MAKTILVVDDVTFVRKVLIELLTDAGFEVVGEAEDGEQAVERYRTLKPDAVTMDIVMPKMGGIDATRHIIKHDKNAIIVMVSAMDQMNLITDAIHAGARDYIQKPFHSKDVIQVLERAMRTESHSAQPSL